MPVAARLGPKSRCGRTWLLSPLPPEDPAPPLPGSGELGDASEGPEPRRLASCGPRWCCPAAREGAGHCGPGVRTESVAGGTRGKGALNFAGKA